MPFLDNMSLPEKQRLFGRLYFRLGAIVCDWPGVALVPEEGYVAITDTADGDYDGPHKRGGNHYNKLAHDNSLWMLIAGKWTVITNGDHHMWVKIGELWESLHPLCRWGGRWGDANHLGIEHEGRA